MLLLSTSLSLAAERTSAAPAPSAPEANEVTAAGIAAPAEKADAPSKIAPASKAGASGAKADARSKAAPASKADTPAAKADAPAETLAAADDLPTGEAAVNDEPVDESGDVFDPAAPEADSLLWTLVRTLLVLGLVIVCIYLVLNVGLRRMMGVRAVGGSANALVSVVERIPLDQKHSLLVLKAAGEYLLVGTGDGGMSLISKLQTEEVERLQRERAVESATMSPFLQKLLSRGGHPPPSA